MNIVPIILLIASIGLFFGYIDPTNTKIKELLAEKTNYNLALDKSKELGLERDRLLVKFNEMPKADKDKLLKLLPDNIDNIRLIIDIDNMAKAYGMRIRNFKAEVANQKETLGKDLTPYGTLTLSFSTTASYNFFLTFMKDLEHSLRIMDVTSIVFNSSDTNQLYDYNVTLKTYWLK